MVIKRLLKITLICVALLALLLSGPLYIMLSGSHDTGSNWRTSSRDSAGLAPPAGENVDAVVQVYAARAFRWRGYFAVHTWISVKEAGADHYTVYDVTGFRRASVNARRDVPDRAWYGSPPQLIADIRGDRAEQAIAGILEAVEHYPYANDYNAWPGPNSNTFVAWVIREVPELDVALPSHAVGKDYLGGKFISKAPSGTGYQANLGGFFGVMLGLREGLEFNVLGLSFGVSPLALGIKLPGIGDLSLRSVNPMHSEPEAQRQLANSGSQESMPASF